jgi:hypothetical protein
MLLDHRSRHSVGFLYVGEEADTREPVGTAFFVSVFDEGESHVYAVTAGHIIDGVRGTARQLYLRARGRDDSTYFISVPVESWWLSAEADAAVAMVTAAVDPNQPTIRFQDELVDDTFIEQKDIDVGADVFFIGLFAPGREFHSSRPIARFGNIALMPEDVPIDYGDGQIANRRVYLVEARSWAGHSGSPAFVYFQSGHGRSNQLGGDPFNDRGFLPGFGRVLGVVSAHFDVPMPIGPGLAVEVDNEKLELKVNVNSGVAAVTPSQAIIDLLGREDVSGARRR